MLRQDIDTLPGFGLAPIKPEGMCFSYEFPNLSWWPYDKEFDLYFNETYGTKWYLKPIIRILRKIAKHSWDVALFENAKNKGEQ